MLKIRNLPFKIFDVCERNSKTFQVVLHLPCKYTSITMHCNMLISIIVHHSQETFDPSFAVVEFCTRYVDSAFCVSFVEVNLLSHIENCLAFIIVILSCSLQF